MVMAALKNRAFLHFLCRSSNLRAWEFCTGSKGQFCYYSRSIGRNGNFDGNDDGNDPMFRKFVVEKCRRGFTNLQDALNLYQEMISKNPLPSIIEFNQLTTAVARLKRYAAVLFLYKHLEFVGIVLNWYSLAIMMNCYCKLSHVDLGFSVLGKIIKLGFRPDRATFNTLLNGLALNGNLTQAMELLHKIVQQGFQPDKATFSSLANRFMSNGNLLDALRTYPALVDLLCKVGTVEDAHRVLESVFQRGEAPNCIVYAYVVHGYCSRGKIDEALKLLDVMVNRGYEPDLTLYGILIRGCCRQHKMVEEALHLFHETYHKGLVLDVETCNVVINSCSRTGRLQAVQQVLDYMQRHGPTPDVVTYNFIIKGFCVQGMQSEATELLQVMERNGCPANDYTYNIIIRGYLKKHEVSKAMEYTNIMVGKGFRIHSLTAEFLGS